MNYKFEANLFYEDPHGFMDDILTTASMPGWSWTGHNHPSHVIVYGSLLDQVGTYRGKDQSIRDILSAHGYSQVWTQWNGVDWAEDDEAKGQLYLWAKDTFTAPNTPSVPNDEL